MFLEDDRPAPITRYGKYPAIVLEDDVEDSAHTGKIKVRVPGILEEDERGDPRPIEVIARPCLPPGFFFVPAEGSHVWVEFAAGDIDSPIWVGVWYPDNAPPRPGDGSSPEAPQKAIFTPGGHVVTLDDDAESIAIRDKHGNEVKLAGDGVTLSHKNAGAKIEIRDGVVTIHASNRINLGENANKPILRLENELGGLASQFFELLLTHTHIGNMGVVTGPPLFRGSPAVVPANFDPEQFTSRKVFAE